MNILAIETSCDETGVALLKVSGGVRAPKAAVLDNLVASQIKIHQPFGGVVPNLAKREHLKNLPILFKKLQSRHKPLTFDLITVTVGPGLEPALWTGITFAQALAKEYKKPLVGANHLEGHLYSALLPGTISRGKAPGAKKKKIAFPAVALIVSGGHTVLLKLGSFSEWQRLGETRDDAAGEAFDKVARMLELPYPGGPEIQKLALEGDPNAIPFARPMLHDKSYDFSFSGLKTSVLYYLRDHREDGTIKPADVAASFQQAAVDVLVAKTIRAVREAGAKSVILCGGVAANKKLRLDLGKASRKAGAAFFVPPFKYNLDNGAMIGLAGYMAYERKKRYPFRANGNLEI